MKFVIALALLATATAAPAAESADSLLAQMKAACGGPAWDRVQGWHETGSVGFPDGRTAENEVWHDMRSLKSAMIGRIDGKVVRRAGFDGTTYWQAGPDGKTRTGTDLAGLRKQRRDAYLSSFGWFFRGRFPANVQLAADQAIEGETFQVLKVTPQDADSFELWVDRSTHLVRRIVAGKEYADLTEYKTFDGVCTPTWAMQGDGNPQHEITLLVRTVDTSTPAPASVFAPPN
jgi:hypothetical protein